MLFISAVAVEAEGLPCAREAVEGEGVVACDHPRIYRDACASVALSAQRSCGPAKSWNYCCGRSVLF